jgi:hypothetical protein
MKFSWKSIEKISMKKVKKIKSFLIAQLARVEIEMSKP